MRSRVCGLAAWAAWGWAVAASASGPFATDAAFWWGEMPGVTSQQMIAGELGILDSGQDRQLLVVAYRHLVGKGWSAAERAALTSRLAPPSELSPLPDQPLSPISAWLEARKQVPGADPSHWVSTTRWIPGDPTDPNDYGEQIENCLDDAFRQATHTLTARIAQFGAESVEVAEWLHGQDVVFAACGDGEALPVALEERFPPLLRANRVYQIAAATFYTQRYFEAEARFTAIAADAASPWRGAAKYLIGRCRLRRQDYAGATAAFEAVLADRELAPFHASARGLVEWAAARSKPLEMLAERGRQLAEGRGLTPAELPRGLVDYTWLLRHHGAAEGDDLGAWVELMHNTEVGAVGGHERWRAARKSLPWLVAALLDPGEFDDQELLAAAAKVDTKSPAFATVSYHRARRLIDHGQPGQAGEARAVIERALQSAALGLGDRNRFRHLRASLAADVDAYLADNLLEPVATGVSDGWSFFPQWLGPGDPRQGALLLTDDAVRVLNRGTPLPELARLARRVDWPGEWRQRLAVVAWTRAVLAKDDTLARELGPLLAASAPELAPGLAAWAAAQGAEREFAAAMLFLRFPGLSPRLGYNVGRQTPLGEIDSLRANGWCAGGGVDDDEALPELPFAREPSEGTVGPFPDLAPAAVAVGREVLRLAALLPEHPDLAEALHRVVKLTRYGCSDATEDNGRVSKAAFERLHRQFPRSSWAKQTPYWFQ